MAEKCVVEGCNLEYDVICSFSFYNVNVGSDDENLRQEWIEGAMQESECLRRNVNLQLCGYHFELDSQGLWMDSPMLSELLTLHEQPPLIEPTAADKKAAELIRTEHNYCAEPKKEEPANITRLNVRQLVDTLGYLSLKNLQRKQLWIVKVETDKSEATITQSEQVITKMSDPKQIIEIIPQTATVAADADISQNEVYQIMDESELGDNFIYEIAEEQEITMDEVKEIPVTESNEWTVNIVPEEPKPKYAYIKHYNTGKKKRHFTSEMNEITLHGDSDNYYILPDVDPSVGVEITTSYEPENYIVQEYENYVIEERPRKRREPKEFDPNKKKKKRQLSAGVREQVNQIQIKNELDVQIKNELVEEQDWTMDNTIVYDQDGSDDYDDRKGNNPRVRRKNKKYLGYDFVT